MKKKMEKKPKIKKIPFNKEVTIPEIVAGIGNGPDEIADALAMALSAIYAIARTEPEEDSGVAIFCRIMLLHFAGKTRCETK